MTAHAIRLRVEQALALADRPAARHVFTLRLDEEARAAADAADAARAARSRLPFLGIPITVKDNFDLAGFVTTAGSTVLRDAAPAQEDAPVVSRLREAGFIILGRTNMTEFAFSGLGLNPHYGTPLNPAFPDEARIPGGSSSGAAVSVALGIAPVAIGTDTGGSLRIPAAFCGLAGFKPTSEAVSRVGVVPLSTTLDTVGVIGRTARDCLSVFDVIRTQRRSSPLAPVRPDRLRLGVVENYVTQSVGDDVAAGVQKAVELLEEAGVGIENITVPEFDSIPDILHEAAFAAAEAYAWHHPLLQAGRGTEYDPRVLVRIEAGREMHAGAYVRLVERRRAFIAAVTTRIAGLDALLFPTAPMVAPTFDSLATDEQYHAANALVLRNSMVVNLLDGCAISLPCPGGAGPVGLTLAAAGGCDDDLLNAAILVESILKGAGDGGRQGA